MRVREIIRLIAAWVMIPTQVPALVRLEPRRGFIRPGLGRLRAGRPRLMSWH